MNSNDHQILGRELSKAIPLLTSFFAGSRIIHLAKLDRDGVIRFVNPTLAAYLKVDSSKIVGLRFSRFLTGLDGELFTNWLSGKEVIPADMFILNVMDGDQVPCSFHCRLATDADGFLLLAEPPQNENKAFQEELLQLNNQLTVLSRENIRKGRELSKALTDLKKTQAMLVHRTTLLENERTLAHKVLENILPQRFELPGFTTAVIFRPSDKIGGDFFDAWSDGNFTHFLIGDISGHSTSAALMMAVSKGIFRTLGNTMIDPVEIVTAANRMLCPMMIDSQMFLTLVYVMFDRRDNNACLVSAGHNPVYYLSDKGISTIDSTGPVIGWDEEDAWESVHCCFVPGMQLFLYTDGLTEATDPAGKDFSENLLAELAESRLPQALAEGIFAAAEKFTNGNFADDLTIFVLERDRTGT